MPIAAFAAASAASAGLWVGAAMVVGVVFASQIEFVLAWIQSHLALGGFLLGALIGAYVMLKAIQRWRMTRFLAGAMIDVEELRERLSQHPRPFVIDVGSNLAHHSRPHIPGAVLLDLDAIARMDDFPQDREIVLYCACPNEESARRGAKLLLQKGYRRVRPLVGGIDAWSRAGFPVEHGTTVTFKPAASVAARTAS